jgi:hypothetical protein
LEERRISMIQPVESEGRQRVTCRDDVDDVPIPGSTEIQRTGAMIAAIVAGEKFFE